MSNLFQTASFVTQQDIAGENTDYINDAELRNAPDVHAWRRGDGVPILLVTGAVFQSVDQEPSNRQLYEIAELGKPQSEPTRSPEFMRLLVAPEQAARPQRDLRAGVPGTSTRHGDCRSSFDAALPLATRICRTGDWLYPARVSRPM
jgi:hypothetical protein